MLLSCVIYGAIGYSSSGCLIKQSSERRIIPWENRLPGVRSKLFIGRMIGASNQRGARSSLFLSVRSFPMERPAADRSLVSRGQRKSSVEHARTAESQMAFADKAPCATAVRCHFGNRFKYMGTGGLFRIMHRLAPAKAESRRLSRHLNRLAIWTVLCDPRTGIYRLAPLSVFDGPFCCDQNSALRNSSSSDRFLRCRGRITG